MAQCKNKELTISWFYFFVHFPFHFGPHHPHPHPHPRVSTWAISSARLLSIRPLRTNLSKNIIKRLFFHENAFEKVGCKMAAILSRWRWVNVLTDLPLEAKRLLLSILSHAEISCISIRILFKLKLELQWHWFGIPGASAIHCSSDITFTSSNSIVTSTDRERAKPVAHRRLCDRQSSTPPSRS